MTQRRVTAVLGLLVALAAPACSSMFGATPVASLEDAQAQADAIVAKLGIEPDSREVLERSNTRVNTLADTVMLRWEDFPDRPDDPIEAWVDTLQAAGFTVTTSSSGYPEGRPNSGDPDSPEIQACLPGADPRLGAEVSIGQVDTTRVAVALQVGGPPAASGCARAS